MSHGLRGNGCKEGGGRRRANHPFTGRGEEGRAAGERSGRGADRTELCAFTGKIDGLPSRAVTFELPTGYANRGCKTQAQGVDDAGREECEGVSPRGWPRMGLDVLQWK